MNIPSSKNLTRQQLIGMIASLRGAVWSLLHGHPQDREEDIENAKLIMKLTTSNVDDEDLKDGAFDMSWDPRHTP